MQFGFWQKRDVINLCGVLTAVSLISGCFGSGGYLDDYDIYVTNPNEEVVDVDANDAKVADTKDTKKETKAEAPKEANGDVVASGPVKGLVADDDIEYDEDIKRKGDDATKSDEKASMFVDTGSNEHPLPEKATSTPVEVAMVDKKNGSSAKLEVKDGHDYADDAIVPEAEAEENYEDEVMSKQTIAEDDMSTANDATGSSLSKQIEHELQYSDGGRIKIASSAVASDVALTEPKTEEKTGKKSTYSLEDVLSGKKETNSTKGKTHSLEEFDESMSGVSVHVATLYHPNGSADIDAKGRKELAKIRKLVKNSNGTIRIIGHASSRTNGMDLVNHMMANFEVSNTRAKYIAKQLIAMGVPAEKMFVGAVSDADPIYYEVMPEGEAMNRRTEIYLDY